jgi:hypothetical protein
MRTTTRLASAGAIALLAATPLLTTATPAWAGKDAAIANAVPESEELTAEATIKAIDPSTRTLSLARPSGETFTVTAGPTVRLQLLKVGDRISVKFYRSVAFMLSTPSQKVPDNVLSAAAARPVGAPGGLALTQIRVSGTVVSIDLATHSLQLVNPSGGRVYTFWVTNPKRQAQLPRLKVGDTLTAVVTDALAVDVQPAP